MKFGFIVYIAQNSKHFQFVYLQLKYLMGQLLFQS